MTTEEQNDIFLHIILPMLLDLVDKYMWFPDITPLKHLHKDQFQQLLDYNKKHKMWVKINFSDEINKEIEKVLIGILSKDFIEKATSSS